MITDFMEIQPDTREIVKKLQEEYPDVPLLALGQTIFWDEPTKAAIRRIFDILEPKRRMILGVHDTDYFSKAPQTFHAKGAFAVVPHNDGSTQGLWAAAGEISRLFGCEVVPTKEILHRHGVFPEQIARHFGMKHSEMVDTATEAWGWRGLVQVGERDVLAMDVKVSDFLPQLLEMLQWGTKGTCESVPCSDKSICLKMTNWVQDFADLHPDALLTALYKDFLPRIYEELLGEPAHNVDVSASSEIFRFNTKTAARPRFHFLDLFLQPKTRSICSMSYNEALMGSEIYTLDRFGHGAIPFDLVVPGQGRGTLHVLPDSVMIDLPDPVTIPTEKPVESARDLAAVVSAYFGDQIALVGKALTLINMIAGEFLLVFHTLGSSYVHRTLAMNKRIQEEGVSLKLNPILRISLHTWDSLKGVPAEFHLPDHLAASFGKKEISADEFGNRWHDVIKRQTTILDGLRKVSSSRDLMALLRQSDPTRWDSCLVEYDKSRKELAEIGQEAVKLKEPISELYEKIKELKELVERQEIAKGNYFREHIRPLKEELSEMNNFENPKATCLKGRLERHEAIRADMTSEIEKHQKAIHQMMEEVNQLKKKMLSLQRGERVLALRKRIEEIESKAEQMRLNLVRQAYFTSKGLPYTNYRPSAWWFLMVDPTRKWFEEITRSAELYLEYTTQDVSEDSQ